MKYKSKQVAGIMEKAVCVHECHLRNTYAGGFQVSGRMERVLSPETRYTSTGMRRTCGLLIHQG